MFKLIGKTIEIAANLVVIGLLATPVVVVTASALQGPSEAPTLFNTVY